MLFRFLVAHNHPKLPDVPPHFHADVCSQLIFDLLLVDGFTRSDAKCRCERVQFLLRCASFGLPAAHPVKTSTRIPILSPEPTASAADVGGLLQVALSKIRGDMHSVFHSDRGPPRISDQR